MATLGELNILLSVKGISKVKDDLKSLKKSLDDTGAKQAQTDLGKMERSAETTRQKITGFDRDLKNTRSTLRQFSSNLREVQQASNLVAVTIGGPLALAISTASKTNIELSRSLQSIQLSSTEVLNSIGTSLTPIIKEVSRVIKDLSKEWLNLPKSQRDSIVQFAAYAVAVAAAISITTKFSRALIGLAKILATPSGIFTAGLIGVTFGFKKLGDVIDEQAKKTDRFVDRLKQVALFASQGMAGRAGLATSLVQSGMNLGARKKAGQSNADILSGAPTPQVNLGTISTRGSGLSDTLNSLKTEFDKVFGALAVNADRVAQHIAEAFGRAATSLSQGFGQAVGEAIVFGKNFEQSMISLLKNVTASIISDLVEIAAKKAALGLIGSFTGGIGGIFGGIGSFFGLPHFAEGGIVTKPTLAVVGESGPEAIIPQDKMGQMGGGNFTINSDVIFLQDQAAMDKFFRKGVEAMKRITNRRTGGTTLAF